MATPYMGLNLPTPSVTLGPAYATQNNAAFTTIDSHDHTAGKGTPVPTAGILINADLGFGGFNLISARSLRMVNNASAIGLSGDLNCLSVAAGNLYYNNASGQQIQITAGGALNAASVGGIGGDYATSSASVSYTAASTTFFFTQSAGVAALMSQGATTILDTGASANGVTLSVPAGLAASYGLTFPTALPGATKILTLNASGQIGAAYDVDGTTLSIASNLLSVANGGIGTAQIANSAVTPTQMSGTNFAISSSFTFTSSSQTFVTVTGASVALTCSGLRPVEILLVPDGSTSQFAGVGTNGSTTAGMFLALYRGVTNIANWSLSAGASSGAAGLWAPSAIRFMDFDFSSGSQTYTLQARAVGSGTSFNLSNCKIVAYERV